MAENSKNSEGDQAPSRINRAKSLLKRQWRVLLIALVIVGVLFLAYGYIHTRNQLNQLSNPKTAAKNQTQDIVNKAGKLVELPSGETPTLATVNDINKLKSQAFFAPAQNGDKVLIYSKSGWAVLYRPSTNKVVEFSRINLNNQ